MNSFWFLLIWWYKVNQDKWTVKFAQMRDGCWDPCQTEWQWAIFVCGLHCGRLLLYRIKYQYGTTKAFEEVLRWMASSEWMSVYPCSLVLTEGESSPIGYFMAFSFENEIFLKNQCLWLCVLSFPFVFLSIFDGVAIWMDGDERSMPSHSFLLARTMFKPIKALMRFRVLEFY